MGAAGNFTPLTPSGNPSVKVFFVLAICFVALAQEPIGPLRRMEEVPGQYTWSVSLTYTPSGKEGFGIDEFGTPYTYTRFVQEWRLSFSGTVQLFSGLKIGGEAAQISTITKELRRYQYGEERSEHESHGLAYLFFCETRMDPKNPWDPRISILFGRPWTGGVSLSLSLLRDPIVIVAEFSFRGQEEEPQGWFTSAVGAGFVANPWISISTTASLAIPVIGIGVPQTSLGLRIRYALDLKGKAEIGASATIVLRGDRSWLTLGVA